MSTAEEIIIPPEPIIWRIQRLILKSAFFAEKSCYMHCFLSQLSRKKAVERQNIHVFFIFSEENFKTPE